MKESILKALVTMGVTMTVALLIQAGTFSVFSPRLLEQGDEQESIVFIGKSKNTNLTADGSSKLLLVDTEQKDGKEEKKGSSENDIIGYQNEHRFPTVIIIGTQKGVSFEVIFVCYTLLFIG